MFKVIVFSIVASSAIFWGCQGKKSADGASAAVKEGDGAMAVTMTIQVSSDAFTEGQTIPRKYTGEGQNISPPLRWAGTPSQAKELVLIVDDPDAPRGIFTHWVLYNMPPQTDGLTEGIDAAPKPSQPAGSVQGKNSADKTGYIGPMPPPGHGVHHYRFHVYALDKPLNLQPGLTREEVLKAIQGHVVAEGQLVGIYERK